MPYRYELILSSEKRSRFPREEELCLTCIRKGGRDPSPKVIWRFNLGPSKQHSFVIPSVELDIRPPPKIFMETPVHRRSKGKRG